MVSALNDTTAQARRTLERTGQRTVRRMICGSNCLHLKVKGAAFIDVSQAIGCTSSLRSTTIVLMARCSVWSGIRMIRVCLIFLFLDGRRLDFGPRGGNVSSGRDQGDARVIAPGKRTPVVGKNRINIVVELSCVFFADLTNLP